MSAIPVQRRSRLQPLAAALMLLVACDNLDPFEAGENPGPGAPVSLAAAPAGPTAIGLNWTPAAGDTLASGYRLYRDGIAVVTVHGTSHMDGGLAPSTTYTYWVAAIDAEGRMSSISSPATATTLSAGQADTTPPTTPTNLAAVPASSSAIGLNWNPSSDAAGVLGYRIYRGGIEIAQASGTSYTDTGLSASTSYTYTVAAFDAAGHLSAPSNPASATTLAEGGSDTQAPSTPGTLTATATSPTSATLSWSPSSDNVGVLGYRVYRNGTQVGTTAGTTYDDTGLSPSTSYSYTVLAYDAAGNASGTSPSAVVTTPAAGGGSDTQPPTAPGSLTATVTGPSTVDLSWTPATDNVGVTGYRVYRNGVQIATTAGTAYTDSGLTPATVYTYGVVAIDAAGNASSPSGSATATTQAPPDTEAPTRPTGLSATATGFSSVALNWSPATDNVGVTGYRIFRDGVQIGTATGTSYTDTGLDPLTSYTYSVAAYDAAGNVSPQSATATATTVPLF